MDNVLRELTDTFAWDEERSIVYNQYFPGKIMFHWRGNINQSAGYIHHRKFTKKHVHGTAGTFDVGYTGYEVVVDYCSNGSCHQRFTAEMSIDGGGARAEHR